MNAIYNLFLGTPTDSGKKKSTERPKVSDDDDPPSENAAVENQGSGDDRHKKQPPGLPQRSSFARGKVTGRARSLSRVYNQVPRDRPDFRRAQQDMIEYYAHLAMIETDPDRVKEENEHLQEAIQGCRIRRYGRIYSRLQIACLCIDVGVLNTDPAREGELQDEPCFPADLWSSLREQLIIVKGFMLRKDANMLVAIEKPRYSDDGIPEENDELDSALDKHEMFQASYNEVNFLLKIQETLARFCEQLKGIDSESPEIVKEVESAVDTYKQALQKHFVPDDAQGSENKQDEKDTQPIPEVLDFFLLRDIQAQPKEALAKLLHHVLRVLHSPECVYSHSQLKQKMKAVLTKWSESILDIPKLVQLGYGGVMAPIVTGDDDDVSSYGVAEDHFLTQKQNEDKDNAGLGHPDAEPIPFRSHSNRQHGGRRTSFADEARASAAANLTSRNLPSKSPRTSSRKNGRKKSPPQSPRRQRDANFRDDDDDDSYTEDPTGSVHQYGGASNSPNSVEKRRNRAAVPHRDSDEESAAHHRAPVRSPASNRHKRRRPPQLRDPDPLWDDPEDVEVPYPKRRTYMDWTVEETNAVREGYAAYGKRWAMIKHNSRHRLSRRTNVQIKDKWRTMVKAGEIEELPEP